MSFGKNLARVRKGKGWTQEALAQKSGVPISNIRHYETDDSVPRVPHVARLAKVLAVSADDLIFDPGEGIARQRVRDPELLAQFEAIQELPEAERRSVKLLLESVIVKSRLQEMVIPKATSGPVTSNEDKRSDEVTRFVDDLAEAFEKRDRRRGAELGRVRGRA